MLQDKKAYSSFSVNDTHAAYDFYKNTLGLDVVKGDMGILELHLSGNQNGAIIYPKQDHQPATFTILNFPVDDIEATVDWLIEKGIAFEQYDLEYIKTNSKGIARGGEGPEMAWFKDPAGNILAIQGK
ncbi:MAG: VOC family protein [Chitinophagaceae bacterium]|nr:MAG: VOC family protein [Chitinophagaceae bacterium]